jgi:hypothetical protein
MCKTTSESAWLPVHPKRLRDSHDNEYVPINPTNVASTSHQMCSSPSISSSSHSNLSANATRFALASILVCAALIMGGLGVAHTFSMLGNNWVFQRSGRIAVFAAAFFSAFISSTLFLVAARLLYSTTQQKPIAGSQRFSTAAIVLALYAPFYWAFNSSWLHLLPVLPGFTAGMFTKPLDSRLAFFAASGTCTVLLLVSLCIIRNRVRYGRFNAPVIALCASVIASYAAYSFMRA